MFGLGRSGVATCRALAAGGADVVAADDTQDSLQAASSAGIQVEDLRGADWRRFAALVVLSGTLISFDLPAAGIGILLAVDELMDMARTATNVLGNCLATVVVAKWEGEFDGTPKEPAAAEAAARAPGAGVPGPRA